MKNVWTLTGGRGMFENDSVESDCRGKSDGKETADQKFVWNHSAGGGLSKW